MSLFANNGHDVFFAHYEQFVAVNFDGLAAVLAEQNFVADFNVKCAHFTVVANLTVTYGKYFTLVRLFSC